MTVIRNTLSKAYTSAEAADDSSLQGFLLCIIMLLLKTYYYCEFVYPTFMCVWSVVSYCGNLTWQDSETQCTLFSRWHIQYATKLDKYKKTCSIPTE